MIKRDEDFCEKCIISPCCSEICFKILIFLHRGKKAASKFAIQSSWDGSMFLQDLEKSYGFSPFNNLSNYYLQVSEESIKIKFTDLKKLGLKKKNIYVGQVVHGRFFIDEMEAYILPHNRVAIDIDHLG